MNANESRYERHIQNSNTESKNESESGLRAKREEGGSADEADNLRRLPKRELPLGIVLDACPNVRWLTKGGDISQWREFLAAADLARPVLGIAEAES